MRRKFITITAIAAAIMITGCTSWIEPIEVPASTPITVEQAEAPIKDTEPEEVSSEPISLEDLWNEQHPGRALETATKKTTEESEVEENDEDQTADESASEYVEQEQAEERSEQESGEEPLLGSGNETSESGEVAEETEQHVESEPVEEEPVAETYNLSEYEFMTMYGANASQINIRKGPGTNYDKAGYIGLGSKVQAARYNNDWYIINHNDQAYFISADYLSEEDQSAVSVQSTNTAATTTSATPSTTINTDYAAWNAVAQSVETEAQKALDARCAQMEANGMVGAISSKADAQALMNYYQSYGLLNTNDHYWSYDGSSVWCNITMDATREATANQIINKFGVAASSDTFQTVRDTCARVRSKMTFDLGWVDATTTSAVANGRGVCIHYAAIAKVLLNAEGIPTRTVIGYGPTGNGHAWNQCYINGAWYTVDFTPHANSSITPDGFVSSGYVSSYRECDTLVL